MGRNQQRPRRTVHDSEREEMQGHDQCLYFHCIRYSKQGDSRLQRRRQNHPPRFARKRQQVVH